MRRQHSILGRQGEWSAPVVALLRRLGFIAVAMIVLVIAVVTVPFSGSLSAFNSPADAQTDDLGVDPLTGIPTDDELDAALDSLLGTEVNAPETVPSEVIDPALIDPLTEPFLELPQIDGPGILVDRTDAETVVTIDLATAQVVPTADDVIGIARHGGGDILDIDRVVADTIALDPEEIVVFNDELPDTELIFIRLTTAVDPRTLTLGFTTTPGLEGETDTYSVLSQDKLQVPAGIFPEFLEAEGNPDPIEDAVLVDPLADVVPDSPYLTPLEGQDRVAEIPAVDTDVLAAPTVPKSRQATNTPGAFTAAANTTTQQVTTLAQATGTCTAEKIVRSTKADTGRVSIWNSSPSYTYVRASESAVLTSIVVTIDPATNGQLWLGDTNSPRVAFGGFSRYSTYSAYLVNGRSVLPYEILERGWNGYATKIRIPVDRTVSSGQYLRVQLPISEFYANNIKIDLMQADCTTTPPPSGLPIGGPDPAWTPNGVCSEAGATVWVNVSPQFPKRYELRTYTELWEVPFGSATGTKVEPNSGWIYNALAYNPADGWLYAVSQGRLNNVTETGQTVYVDEIPTQYPAGHLLRISPVDHSVQNMGKIRSTDRDFGTQWRSGTYNIASAWPNDVYGGMTTGVIDANGNYLISNSSDSGSGKVYRVPLTNNPSAVTTSMKFGANDHTILRAAPEYSWGIVNNTTTIERVNLTTGVVSRWSLANLRTAGGQALTAGTYGTAWTFGNDNLGFGRNSTNEAYQIKVTNPTATNPTFQLVSATPGYTGYNNDATSNGFAKTNVDLGIKKNFLGIVNGRAEWEIEVTNLTPCGSSGFTVSDKVPTGYGAVTVQPGKTFDESGIEKKPSGWIDTASVDTTTNSLTYSHGVLRGGEKATFKLSAMAPSAGQCVENTASVVGNEDDPNTDDNTASDGRCSVTIKKDVKDINGDGKITGDDSNQMGPNGTRKITYTVEIHYPTGGKDATTTYSLTDTPRFSEFVELVGGTVTPDGTYAPKQTFDVGVTPPWNFTPNGDVTIRQGQTHTYTVEAYYTPPALDPTGESWAECSAGTGTPGTALYNEATVKSAGFQFTDDACGPIVKDKPVRLALTKHDESLTDPLGGAAFALHKANEDGSLGEKLRDFTVDASDTSLHTVSNLEAGFYYIVETRSPETYSLLPAPIKFEVTRGDTGAAAATITDSQFVAQVSDKPAPDTDTVVIMVANVRTGSLPETGGRGIIPLMLLSVGLLAAAVVTARRYA